MSKDLQKKTRGDWWYGWVKYTYYDIWTESQKEGMRTTDYDWATAAQAQRAAEALAGRLSAPTPIGRWEKKYQSKTKKRDSLFTIIEVGASRSEAKA
ncbi:MAG TPA: hypothetical protein VIY48_03965 [Candidatus Paceibacterota bacterium]